MDYYSSFSEHLKQRFGFKVYKVPVSLGETCPNRNATSKGCTYCDNLGSASPIIQNTLTLRKQIEKGVEWATTRFKARGFIVYFQPFSNTFLPLRILDEALKLALSVDHVVGISIGTRPDCVPEEMLELIASYAQQTYLWMEYGLQSAHYRTLTAINRGHSLADFIDAVLRTKRKTNIHVSAHTIIGLPDENRNDIIETARIVASLPLDGIKIHLLHILKDSNLAEQFRAGSFPVLSMHEYASLVVDVIERLPRTILIQRITGEAEKKRLLSPLWCLEKQTVINAIHNEFKKRNTGQGVKYKFGLSLAEMERRMLEKISSKLG